LYLNFLVHDRTEHIADIAAAGLTGHRPSTDILGRLSLDSCRHEHGRYFCERRWMRTPKYPRTHAHLCEWCLII